jgi:hypothetical protein
MKLKVTNGKQFSEVKFKKGKQTCPVCHQMDNGWNCQITEDDGMALCSRVPSDQMARNGRQYVHKLRQDVPPSKGVPANPTVEQINKKSDPQIVHEAYSKLLSGLTLSEKHSRELMDNRGLSDTTIANNLYATVPLSKDGGEIGKRLSKAAKLDGVPGFYTDSKCWRLNISVPGFYVPYRDAGGRIVGIQIRKDHVGDDGGKYIWLSSSTKENGCSPGTPLHFANPERVTESGRVLVTEGALKAEIIAEHSDEGVVAMAGVTGTKPADLIEALAAAFPKLEEIVLAFDMDWERKPQVKQALVKVIEAANERFASVTVRTWDLGLGKGYDDLLLSGNICTPEKDGLISHIKGSDFLTLHSGEAAIEAAAELISIEIREIAEPPIAPSQPQLRLVEAVDSGNISESVAQTKPELGSTWRQFAEMTMQQPERVIAGLSRGNVGQLVASTNIGKTTLMLNAAVCAAAGKQFQPLVNEKTVGKRVLYIDGEATREELQADLFKMQERFSPEERESVKDNLYLICDEEIQDLPFDLGDAGHREALLRIGRDFKPDLIVVDTLSALFTMEDENDNAKMKSEVIQPLKNIAKKLNAAVLLLHHTGKYNEGSPQATDAYKGRGASNLGALTRTVFNLKPYKDAIILSCSKIKGEKFEEVAFTLNRGTRWFEPVEDFKKGSTHQTSYQQVVNYVIESGKRVKRDEIDKFFDGKVSTPTITRCLKAAIEKKDLIKTKYGHYCAPGLANPERELPVSE